MKQDKNTNTNDILFHIGEDKQQYFNSIAPPIFQASNFSFNSLEDMRIAFKDEEKSFIYSRGNNPTVNILRKKIALLEKTEDALVCSSGAAAISTSIISQTQAGDHIICVKNPYSWTKHLFTEILPRFGIETTFVDARDIKNIKKEIRPNTKLLFLESPNSMTFELQDLKKCSALAKKHNIITIIDNSYSSPHFQNPIQYGIDIVVHSASKYINGHSDIVAGVIASSKKIITKIFNSEFLTLGVNIAPHDAAQILRGLRTFAIRLERSQASAKKISKYLSSHPKIKKIIYPCNKNFDQYDLVMKQMKGCGGLMTMVLDASRKKHVLNFIKHIKKFQLAVSWGGYESLIMPVIALHDIPNKNNPDIPWNYIRLYIGLEDPYYLIKDLKQALNKM